MKKVIVGILIITIVTGCSSKNNFNIEYENQNECNKPKLLLSKNGRRR